MGLVSPAGLRERTFALHRVDRVDRLIEQRVRRPQQLIEGSRSAMGGLSRKVPWSDLRK